MKKRRTKERKRSTLSFKERGARIVISSSSSSFSLPLFLSPFVVHGNLRMRPATHKKSLFLGWIHSSCLLFSSLFFSSSLSSLFFTSVLFFISISWLFLFQSFLSFLWNFSFTMACLREKRNTSNFYYFLIIIIIIIY